MKFVLVAAAYGFIFIIVEIIAARLQPPQEIARKMGHIMAGLAAACLPFVLGFTEIALLGILFVPAVLISMKKGIFKSVHGVDRSTYGEVYFPLAIALTALIFPENLLFAYGVLTLGISDALASLVGQRYGRKKYKIHGGSYKSYAGSMAFFISAVVIGIPILLFAGGTFLVAIFWSIILAALLTLTEASVSRGLDNLLLPLAAAGLLAILQTLGLFGN